MDQIIEINIIINRCKRLFIEEDIDLTFAEAMVLAGVSSTSGKPTHIAEFLTLDRAHIHRVLKTLIEKGLVTSIDRVYLITSEGRRVLSLAGELCGEILPLPAHRDSRRQLNGRNKIGERLVI